MYTSKFFYLLSSLKKNNREIADFERFVKSPFFNPKEELVEILLYIKKFWRQEETVMRNKLEKKAAYSAIFGSKKYNAGKINDCLYRLSLLLEKYFAIKELEEKPNQEQLFLADALKKRGIDKHYFKETATLQEQLEEQIKTDIASNVEVYLDLAKINEHVYFHPNTLTHSEKENHQRLMDTIENLDIGYFIKKLQFACEMYTRKKVYGRMGELRFIDEMLEIARMDFKDNLTIKAYTGILELFRTKDISKIEEIKKLVLQLCRLENINYKLNLIAQLINALPPYKGRLEQYFELYRFAADNNILLEHGYISPDNFNNVINVACLLGNNDWVNRFFDNYFPHLDINLEIGEKNKKTKKEVEEKRANVKRLFLAYQRYYEGDYQGAYDLVCDLKLKDVSYGLRFHILFIQILLDDMDDTLDDIDFDSRCRAFRTYLNKKHKDGYISASVQKANQNFIKIIRKIYNWKYDRTPIKDLLDELNACQDISFRVWLKYKIDNLGRRN